MHIGVFDSGIGGVTVLRELVRQFPGARFTYLGDTANVPYGSKTPPVIRELCRQALRKLPKKIDALVVACNTASSVALEDIRKFMKKTPVLGVVEPGAWAAVEALEKSKPDKTRKPGMVLVLATRATLTSGAYHKELRRIAPQAKVLGIPCPLFVPMIEEGLVKGPLSRQIVDHYLKKYRARSGIALLACTHYPWIRRLIKNALPRMRVVDSATSVARRLKDIFGVPTRSRAKRKQRAALIDWIFTDPAAVATFFWP